MRSSRPSIAINTDRPAPPRSRRLTTWSLAALVLGVGSGIALHGAPSAWVGTLGSALDFLGRLWITALQFTVLPLVLTQAVLAVLKTERLGVLGLKSVALFAALMLLAGVFTMLVTPPLLALYRVDPETLAALRAGVSGADAGSEVVGAGTALLERVLGLIPTGLRRVLMGAQLLPVLLVGVVLALAARRFAGSRRDGLQRAAQRVADGTMRVVEWILLAAPVGILALSFGMAKVAGGSALGFMTAHVVLASVILLLFTALLYPLTAALSGVPVRELGRALAPVQLVAASTRSSLASLPAMVESGRDRLGLSAAATGFVLPLAVAVFKLNRAITPLVMLLYLAHVFGVPLGPDQILPFVSAIFLFSFTIPGIPGGNPGITTLPLYVAVGLPGQAVLILDAVDAIPDIFKTVVNVTGDLSVAAIVTRRRAPKVAG